MHSLPFYTRSPRLAFLRALVQEHANLSFDRQDLAALFQVVDQRCSELFPTEDRGGWLSPPFLGGAMVHHTLPHVIFSVFAIYLDLIAGSPEAQPFLAHPLNLAGATAVKLDPSEGIQVKASDGEAAPLTDVLFRIPAIMPGAWTADIYGIPGLKDGVIKVGCQMAGESLPTAISGGFLLMHQESKVVLNPVAASFTPAEESLFFTEPAMPSRLKRYRERLIEVLGIPIEVLEHNHNSAKRVLEAYLAK